MLSASLNKNVLPSFIIGGSRLGRVPFILPLISDCVYAIYAGFFASVHRGISFDIIVYFIIETLKYGNIMSRIDYLFIMYYK